MRKIHFGIKNASLTEIIREMIYQERMEAISRFAFVTDHDSFTFNVKDLDMNIIGHGRYYRDDRDRLMVEYIEY